MSSQEKILNELRETWLQRVGRPAPELLRDCRQNLQEAFLRWRNPPVELPPQSVIDEALIHIICMAQTDAYEEAIRCCDEIRLACAPYPLRKSADDALEDTAEAIRAMKESLSSEIVSA